MPITKCSLTRPFSSKYFTQKFTVAAYLAKNVLLVPKLPFLMTTLFANFKVDYIHFYTCIDKTFFHLKCPLIKTFLIFYKHFH